MIFSEVDAFVSLLERFKRMIRQKPVETVTIATRFIQLFESHGVHRNQIPRFFGQGLKISDVKDDEALLSVLNDNLLDSAAELFAVQREWLDGADEQIYPLHDFYKHPEEFEEFIDSVKNGAESVYGVLICAKTDRHETDALIIIEEQVGSVGDRPIYRYHICSNWIFSYWKCRAYIAACVAIAWKRKVFISGRKVSINLVRRFKGGKSFLDRSDGDSLPTGGEHWYPEDMSDTPEVFLDGIKEGDFGRCLALHLWLDLEEKGYMNAELPTGNSRSVFKSVLNKLECES